jgi:RimJ/RimL family protein N-acetyltransferase
MEFPTLTTERLILRELLPIDAADVLIFRGDPEVRNTTTLPFTRFRKQQTLSKRCARPARTRSNRCGL